jgi:hypothetical protein
LITGWRKSDGTHGDLSILIEAMQFLEGIDIPDANNTAL